MEFICISFVRLCLTGRNVRKLSRRKSCSHLGREAGFGDCLTPWTFMLGMGMLGESGPGLGMGHPPVGQAASSVQASASHLSMRMIIPLARQLWSLKLAETYRCLTHRRCLILFFPFPFPFSKGGKATCFRLLHWHGALKHLRTPGWLKLTWAEAALSRSWKRRGYGKGGR